MKKLLFTLALCGVASLWCHGATYDWNADWQGAGTQPDSGVWYYKGCAWDQSQPSTYIDMAWDTDHWYYGNPTWGYTIDNGHLSNYANAWDILAWKAPETTKASIYLSGSILGADWAAPTLSLQVLDNAGAILQTLIVNRGGAFELHLGNLPVNAGDYLYIRAKTNDNGQWQYTTFDTLVISTTVLSPEDYGGTDTEKWQQLAWTVNHNPGMHYDIVCHNNYTITAPITFDNGGALDLTLLGHNAVITLPAGASLSFGRTSVASVVNLKYVTFQHTGDWDIDPLVYMAWITNSTFEKVHFQGDGACNRYYGLYIGRGNGLVFRTANFCNMEVGMQLGSPTPGISDNNQFYACTWHNNKLQGVFLSSVRNSSMIGCSSEWNKGVGIGMHSSSVDTYCDNIDIQACYIFNNCIDTPTRYAIEIGVPQFYQSDWNVWYPQSNIHIYNNMIDGTYQKGGVSIDGRDIFSMINNSVVKNPNESYHMESWGTYSAFNVFNNRDTCTGQFYYMQH